MSLGIAGVPPAGSSESGSAAPSAWTLTSSPPGSVPTSRWHWGFDSEQTESTSREKTSIPPWKTAPLHSWLLVRDHLGGDFPGFRDQVRSPPYPSVNGGEHQPLKPSSPPAQSLGSRGAGHPGLGCSSEGSCCSQGPASPTHLCSLWGS